jgi:hypothetical protein
MCWWLPKNKLSETKGRTEMKNQANEQVCNAGITAGGVLLCAAASAFGDPSTTTPADAAFNRDLVSGILAAATAGGYSETPILEDALTKGLYSPGVLQMADKACRVAGSAALRAALDRAVAKRDVANRSRPG